MSKLCDCEYLSENDYDYLRNDEDWIERLKAKALNEYEVTQLRKLLGDLKTCTTTHISDMFAVGPLKFYFTKQDFSHSARNASGLQGTASQDKFQVKAAFIATIIRFLILKDENQDVALADRLSFLGKYMFLGPELGTSIELTWLNRFERSLRYLKRFVPAERNKILYLTVGNHLEGSTLYTTYITGGANRPETERRVKIFDSLCQVQPRKRMRKVEDAATEASPSFSMPSGQVLKVESIKKKQKTPPAPVNRLALSKDLTPRQPGGFLGDFLRHQSSTLAASASSVIPYELSVLLAAVETQIKADAIDLEDASTPSFDQTEEDGRTGSPGSNSEEDDEKTKIMMTLSVSDHDHNAENTAMNVSLKSGRSGISLPASYNFGTESHYSSLLNKISV